MHYLVAGLAKSGTTALFTSLRNALPGNIETFFEPRTEEQFMQILSRGDDVHTLTKSIVGFITSRDAFIHRFFPNILIVRDPRDQMVSGDDARVDRAVQALGRPSRPCSLSSSEVLDSPTRPRQGRTDVNPRPAAKPGIPDRALRQAVPRLAPGGNQDRLGPCTLVHTLLFPLESRYRA